MKRTLAILLALLMLVGMLPMTALATDSTPTITLTTDAPDTLAVGNTFFVTAELSNNVGFASLTLSLMWNDEAVQFTGFQEKDDDGDTVLDSILANYSPEYNQEKGIVTAARATNSSKNGKLFVANFTVIGSGSFDIALKKDFPAFTYADEDGVDLTATFDETAVSTLGMQEAHVHAYDEGIITTDATCTVDGVKTFTCNCGDSYTEVISATGHTEEAIAAVAATCTTAGSEAYWTCSVCGKLFSDEACTQEIEAAVTVPALAHSRAVKVDAVAGTCTETGTDVYWTCPDCEKWFSDEACTQEITEVPVIPASGLHTDADANDFCDVCGTYIGEAETEVLPVKLVIPEGSTATFYVGANGTGTPIAATDKGVDESNALIHKYELTIPYGSYSCVVTDETHNYGGVGFDFPLQTSIYEESNLTLVLAKFYTTTSSVKINGVSTAVTIDSVDDFSINLVAPGKATIIPGENYLDSTITSGKTYVVAPRLVWAYGNQILYNYTIELNDELAGNLGAKPQINNTFASTLTAIQKKTFAISALTTFTLTAPTAATTEFFYQINNFNDMYLEGENRVSSVDNGDGTTTYTVKYPDFANASYRVTQEGYVTAAGYAKNGASYTVELRQGDPASTETAIASKVGAGSNIEYENSVYLNIDDSKDTNELSLQVGESFRLRAYRAAWEIVNTVTANIMIEPDFHYAVLSGSDVVSVTPVTTQCTGNAKGNWMDLTALKEGTAVIAVWYDAIDVGGNTTLNGTYGATDPARYGYVVVTVGPDKTVTWNPVSHDGDWDAEFDTVYYFGDAGTFTCKPEGAAAVTVQNLNAANAGAVTAVSAEADGSYAVPVQAGSNLITVTTADGTDYMLVRAKKITYSIENKTTGKTSADVDFVITQGDEVCIHFDQFNMPVSKMSGIYNPGYMGTAKTMYTLNGRYTVSSVGTQYDYITDAKSCLTFTALVAGENTLSGGFIQSGSMGDRFGNHRNTTDAGRGTNFSAVNVTGYFGSIEDITFQVEDGDAVELDYTSMLTLKKGSIFVGESTYNNAGTFSSLTSKTTANNSVNWTKTTDTMAAQSQNFALKANVMPNSYYTTLQMRYWYEGEEVHTADLIAGSDTIIPWSEFAHDADKILNVEILVTSGDGAVSKTYSFVWLPGNANLNYVHPMLNKLTATVGSDTVNVVCNGQEGILLTQTDYTLSVGANTTITLNGSQLQKYTNKTNNTQDKSDTVVVQKMCEGQAVGEAVTVLPLTADKYPAGSWTLSDYDISDADALQITVTSYVNSNYSRTYTIALDKAVHEHSYDAGVVTTEPTCTAEGVKTFTCACGDSYTEAIPAKGHTEEAIPVVEATCTETGLTAGVKCSVCGDILTAQETVAALGHTEEAIPAVEASCTESGLTAGAKCSVCGETLTAQESVPAKGHTEEIDAAVAATCTEAGKTEGKHCSVCKEVLVAQEAIDALGHTLTAHEAREATAQAEGNTAYWSCDLCGKYFNDAEATTEIEENNWIIEATGVAAIGETKYATLKEALNAAQAGDTVTLLKDITDEAYILVMANVTLDLAGHNIRDAALFYVTGTLTDSGASKGCFNAAVYSMNQSANSGMSTDMPFPVYDSATGTYSLYTMTMWTKQSNSSYQFAFKKTNDRDVVAPLMKADAQLGRVQAVLTVTWAESTASGPVTITKNFVYSDAYMSSYLSAPGKNAFSASLTMGDNVVGTVEAQAKFIARDANGAVLMTLVGNSWTIE